MAKSNITIKFSDESREALERFTAAVTDMQERASALLPTLCDDGQHVWTAEVCSLVEECAQCMTTRHKSGLDPEPTSDPCPRGCRRDVERTEAPEGTEGAERPTGANLGRIGWLEVSNLAPRQLAREVADGWSKDEYFGAGAATWDRRDWTEATFTPLTPADFGWTVLEQGQVAVDRDDLTEVVERGTYLSIKPTERLRAALRRAQS